MVNTTVKKAFVTNCVGKKPVQDCQNMIQHVRIEKDDVGKQLCQLKTKAKTAELSKCLTKRTSYRLLSTECGSRGSTPINKIWDTPYYWQKKALHEGEERAQGGGGFDKKANLNTSFKKSDKTVHFVYKHAVRSLLDARVHPKKKQHIEEDLGGGALTSPFAFDQHFFYSVCKNYCMELDLQDRCRIIFQKLPQSVSCKKYSLREEVWIGKIWKREMDTRANCRVGTGEGYWERGA